MQGEVNLNNLKLYFFYILFYFKVSLILKSKNDYVEIQNFKV